MITNEAAQTRDGIASRKALLDNGFNITILFSPEHGLDVTGADGHAMSDGTDTLTGLPVISLYGERLAPEAEHVKELDILLFDVPDVGSRFYTYLWTLTHVMEGATKFEKKLVVLDRPNPISGILELAEGPFLDEVNSSFIGRWEMPIRHSLTLGELALYFNETKKIAANIDVIRCKGWNRELFQPDWKLAFIPTSPAIQSFESMLLYPGLCLLEATNLSEGRGTPYSFTAIGAPWLQAERVAAMLNDISGGEFSAHAITFTPEHSKFNGQLCKAVRLEIHDRISFRPVLTGMICVKLIKTLHPEQFEWDIYPTNVNPSGKNHLDKLTGILGSEQLFDLPFAAFITAITKQTHARAWKEMVQQAILY
ncbi:hypothetical protein KACHI17_07490 [Sediminibacterium sp. KACHI17]|uniref:DUF1343 domain-containing protein n=2 Tax=Sediminibacterium sp. KACHI17 TaxID=1751071 RepID=A0AAT9GH14_9BACT